MTPSRSYIIRFDYRCIYLLCCLSLIWLFSNISAFADDKPSAPIENDMLNVQPTAQDKLDANNMLLVPGRKVTLNLKAKLSQTNDAIAEGVKWRIFTKRIGVDNLPKIISRVNGGEVSLKIAPGSYVIHAAYGFATVAKQVNIVSDTNEEIILNAGALKFDAIIKNTPITDISKLRFRIYRNNDDEYYADDQETKLLVDNAEVNKVYRVPGGAYHIESYYGYVNAMARADINVPPGRVIEATLTHHAAKITFILTDVNEQGSLANTVWTILGQGGDSIYEKAQPALKIILQEGQYTVIAHNSNRNYQRTFKVVAGEDRRIVLFVDK